MQVRIRRMPLPLKFGLLLVLLSVTPVAAQTSSDAVSQRPLCPEAPDDQHGYAPDKAIGVGGGPLYGAARQRRYLDTLRGPEGQAVTYKRLGQVRAPDETILDAYEVTYAGLEKPVRLLLDWYHFDEPRLPRGFSCAAPFSLGTPPVDPFRESTQRLAVAVAQAATLDLTPIPLQVEGKPLAGVIYDDFRLLALAARAAAAKGTALDSSNPPAALKGIGMVVVTNPYPCESRVLTPAGVVIHGPTGPLVPRAQPQALNAEQLALILPGVQLAAGAQAFAYQLARPRPNDTVVLSYMEDGCEVERNILRVPVRATPLAPLSAPAAELPANAKGPGTVFLQAIVDFDGRFREPVVIGGPDDLVAAARAAIDTWRAEPPRLNGAPLATGVMLQVRVGAR